MAYYPTRQFLEKYRDRTIGAVEVAGFKIALDAITAYTPLYEVESKLKQGGKFVIGMITAIILDAILSRVAREFENRYAISKAIYFAAFVTLFEETMPAVLPAFIKPLYLNIETKMLEGYEGTVTAAYMVSNGAVQQLDVTRPADSLARQYTTYVVITDKGVYAGVAPYALQYATTTVVKKL